MFDELRGRAELGKCNTGWGYIKLRDDMRDMQKKDEIVRLGIAECKYDADAGSREMQGSKEEQCGASPASGKGRKNW